MPTLFRVTNLHHMVVLLLLLISIYGRIPYSLSFNRDEWRLND